MALTHCRLKFLRIESNEKLNGCLSVSPYLQLLSLSYNVARDTEAMDADLVFLFYNRGIRTFNIVFINKSPLVCCKPREL